MTQREKTLNLLSKLKAMADESRSGSPEEAAIAAARMQEIMFKHKISIAEIDDDAGEEEPIVEMDVQERGVKQAVGWKVDLATAVAKYNFCRCLYSSARRVPKWGPPARYETKPGKIEIIGRESDVQAVSYLYKYLVREVSKLTQREAERNDVTWQGKSQRRWNNSFRRGCVVTIALRLEAMRKEQEAPFAIKSQTCALIKKADADVENWIKAKYPKLGHGSKNFIVDGDAYIAGKRAGENINIGRGKGLGAPAPQLKK